MKATFSAVMTLVVSACSSPVGPGDISGDYVAVDAAPSWMATLTLNVDRTWTLVTIDHKPGSHPDTLRSRYTITSRTEQGMELSMFEGPYLAIFSGVGWLRNDTLRWGGVSYHRSR